MPTPEDIAKQQELLAAHRDTLHLLLRQRAKVGINYIRPETAHGIADARAEIKRIKGALRAWGEATEDLPDDEEVRYTARKSSPIPQQRDKGDSGISKFSARKALSILFSNQKYLRIIASIVILTLPIILYMDGFLSPLNQEGVQTALPTAAISTSEVNPPRTPSVAPSEIRARVQRTAVAATVTAQARIRDAVILSSTAIAKEDIARLDTLRQSGTVIANEDFSNNINNWVEGDTSDGIANKVIKDGALIMTLRRKNIYWYELWQADVQNFIAEVDIAARSPNTGGGIIFGYQDKDNYYIAQMTRDGYFDVYRLQSGQKVELNAARFVSGFLSKDINAANKLSIVRQGDDITVYINNILVRSIQDNAFSMGEVGIMGLVFDNDGAVIRLDNIRLWKLP